MQLLSDLKAFIYRFEDGGRDYFSVSHYLMRATAEDCSLVGSADVDDVASWLNGLGRLLDDSDIYALGMRDGGPLSHECICQTTLVSTLVDANSLHEWEDLDLRYFHAVEPRTVPYVPLFEHLNLIEPDTLSTAT